MLAPDKLGLLAAATWALITVKHGRGLSVEQRVDRWSVKIPQPWSGR